jgi:hypothetical protein
MTYLEKVHFLHQNSIILVVGTVVSKKNWSSKSYFDAVAFLLRPTVPTKVWTGAYTPTLSFLEVGSI